MSFGLGVYSEAGDNLLSLPPLRFTHINVPVTWQIHPQNSTRMCWGVNLGTGFTKHVMVAVVPPKDKGTASPPNAAFDIVFVNGNMWVLIQKSKLGSTLWFTHETNASGPGFFSLNAYDVPRVYVVDRSPPPSLQNTYGIQVYGEDGSVLLNSGNQLLDITDILSISTYRDTVLAGWSNNLVFLNSYFRVAPYNGYYVPPGGGAGWHYSQWDWLMYLYKNGNYTVTFGSSDDDFGSWEVQSTLLLTVARRPKL